MKVVKRKHFFIIQDNKTFMYNKDTALECGKHGVKQRNNQHVNKPTFFIWKSAL